MDVGAPLPFGMPGMFRRVNVSPGTMIFGESRKRLFVYQYLLALAVTP
jgi:hypothetical protein